MKSKKQHDGVKKLGLFDHINHIRNVKDKDYFNNLSTEEKKSFNHYMIFRFLSMDSEIISEISFLSKYFDKIPSENLYKLLIEIIPSKKYTPYIKKTKSNYTDELVEIISKYCEVGSRTSIQYLDTLFQSQYGIDEVKNICRKIGKSDKEISKLIKVNE